MEDSKNRCAKKSIFAATLVVATLTVAGIFVALQQPALAQTASNSTRTSGSTTPTIKGSVSISNATNAFVKANLKVDFNTAANTAKAQLTNGVIIGARLADVQGYLVYSFTVANYDAETSKIVIVDAGNGQVLYTSTDMPLYNGGIGGGGCPHGGGYGGHYGMSGQHANGGFTSSSGMSGSNRLSVLGSNNL